METLTLNMIVKDEAHVIEETLENLVNSFRFDYWVISDTGSSDDTPKIIERFFEEKGIEGQLFYDEWQNFAYNRNKALEHAKGHGDYILVFDADDRIEGQVVLPEQMTSDFYYLNFKNENSTVVYRRIAIFKNSPDIFWRGVVHEFITSTDPNADSGYIAGDYAVISRRAGSRSQDEDKYLKDAELLKKAIENKEDEDLLPRYTFYCARSYRDAGYADEAITWFEKRAQMTEGWSEEAYSSALDVGDLYQLKGDTDKAIDWWQKATLINPKRAEAWFKLAERHRLLGQHYLAFAFAYMTKDLTVDSSNLFVWEEAYDVWGPFEILDAGVKIGRYREAYEAFRKLVLAGRRDIYENFFDFLKSFEPYLDLEVIELISD